MVKNGIRKGQQFYRCKDCRHQFYDNGKFPRMRKSKTTVAAAFRLYFDGASLRKVGRSLRGILGAGVGHNSIWRWATKYVPQVDDFLRNFTPQLSGVWQIDETTLRFRPSQPPTEWQRAHKVRRPGQDWWQWDAIDQGTRFVVGTHVSKTRTHLHGLAFLRSCAELAPRPQAIVTDDLAVYPRLVSRVFYDRRLSRRVEHVHSVGGFRGNQLIERWHGTLEDRITAMRGLKSPHTRIPRGVAIDYNFLRPHLSLGGKTPAQAAQIELPFNDGWSDLLTWATVFRTLREVRVRSLLTAGRPE